MKFFPHYATVLALLTGVISHQLDAAVASNTVSGTGITNAFITNSYFAGNGWGLNSQSKKTPAQTGTITNGQPDPGLTGMLFVPNTVGGGGNNDDGTILGIKNDFDGHRVFDMSIFGDNIYYWSADPQYYAGYLPSFNSTVAAGSPVGRSGLPQYMFNGHIIGLPGDDRSCVEINVTYGTNGEYGSIMEFLPLKSSHANIKSQKFAHPLRLDGNGGTWVGNIPESAHTKYYTANAYLRVTTGGNTDYPALWLDSEGLTGTPVSGALERAGGALWWTDDSANRHRVFTGSNGSGLTNLNAAQLRSGVISPGVLPGFQSPYNTTGGGFNNQATSVGATVAGGLSNIASGNYATVPGGTNNLAAGDFSFAAGYSARAMNAGTFVWSDGSSASAFTSTNNNSFNSRAAGGYRLYTSSSGADGAGVYLATGGSSWTTVSDRNAKKNFSPVDYQAVLNKLARVPVEQWNYKWEANGEVPNIGPMAQDFKRAFYPGRDDNGISTLEFDGVELAAIQGLNQKLETDNQNSEARIQKLESENTLLKARLDRLEQLLAGNATGAK